MSEATVEAIQSHAEVTGSSESGKERRLRNLRPFPPGQSGNKRGSSAKAMLQAELRRQLKQRVKDGRDKGKSHLQRVAAGIIESAAAGNPKSFAVIRDSVDGKPKQELDINANVTVTLADRIARARKAAQQR